MKIKLGSLTLGKIPRIAVSFKDDVSLEAIEDAKVQGVDIFELRVDLYSSFEEAHVLQEVKKFQSVPTLITIRSQAEGGSWNLPEPERLDLFKIAIPYADGVDIELSSKEIVKDVVREAHLAKKLVIVSSHDFEKTPDAKQLERIVFEAKSVGADMVKIATHISILEDLQRLALFTITNRVKPLVTVGMGPEGALSRIFFPALGSLITYASLGEPTGPGQWDFHSTSDLLKKFYPQYQK